MSAFFSTINNNETSFKQQFDISLTKEDKCLLRKQFIQIIPSCFIPEKKQKNYFIPSLRNKSQIEELNKLQSEIAVMEEKIHGLEISKKQKLNKIDDLRCIIRRVANEDCFVSCGFNTQSNQTSFRSNFTQRERCDKRPKTCGKLCEVSQNNDITPSSESQGEEDPQGGVFTDDGITEKTDDKHEDAYCCNSNNNASDCLLQALCYWQEFLPEPKKMSSCFMQSSSSPKV